MTSLITGEGRPFSREDQDYLQDAAQEAVVAHNQILADTITPATLAIIMWGCLPTYTGGATWTISAGVVYLDGQYYKFPGQTIPSVNTTAYLAPNPVDLDSREWADGFMHDSAREYNVSLSTTPPGGGPYVTIRRDGTQRDSYLRRLQNLIDPPGVIKMWSGSPSAIPVGWALCDGLNGTPNLKGRFVVGYDDADPDFNAVGDIGGAKTVTLGVGNLPAHSHNVPPHQHTMPVTTDIAGSDTYAVPDTATGNLAGTMLTSVPTLSPPVGQPQGTIKTSDVGAGDAVNKMPPYYTLCYIVKTSY